MGEQKKLGQLLGLYQYKIVDTTKAKAAFAKATREHPDMKNILMQLWHRSGLGTNTHLTLKDIVDG